MGPSNAWLGSYLGWLVWLGLLRWWWWLWGGGSLSSHPLFQLSIIACQALVCDQVLSKPRETSTLVHFTFPATTLNWKTFTYTNLPDCIFWISPLRGRDIMIVLTTKYILVEKQQHSIKQFCLKLHSSLSSVVYNLNVFF